MFVILLSVGYLLLCKYVCHFIVCGHTNCCVNMFVILLSMGVAYLLLCKHLSFYCLWVYLLLCKRVCHFSP